MGLLTPDQAARYLAISTRQLRDLTRAGSILYVNIGQRDRETRRYTAEDLEAFIEARKCQSTSVQARKRIPSIFAGEVIDFTALQGALPNATPRGGKGPRKSGSRPSKPTQARP